MHRRALFLVAFVLLVSCGSGDDTPIIEVGPTSTAPPQGLTVTSTWQWQLQGDINTTHDADVYDVDLFDVPPETIEVLQADGRLVICYFSAGTAENFRDDVGNFAATDLGAPLDVFPDERFVDIRSPFVGAVMEMRLDQAVEKGCDGVEPDNVAAFDDVTGFDFDAADQLDFNRFIAAAAHERDLLVGLKNDLSQIPDLVGDFDFAVNEQCFEFEECDAYAPFLDAGKPVFNAEYSGEALSNPDSVCELARDAGMRTIIVPVDLDDDFRIACG